MDSIKPYELVIQFKSQITKPPQEHYTQITRSKSGCFNCRKRKKKCDELKPSCSTCKSRCIPCVWPKYKKQKLPKGYQVPQVDEALKNVRNCFRGFIPVQFHKPAPKIIDVTLDETSPNSILSYSNSSVSSNSPLRLASPTPEPLDTETLFPKFQLEKGFSLTLNIEDQFRTACVNGFIISLGPQYTHPLLTTRATFVPFINNNPIMEEIASASGCAFLSWDNPNLNNLAYKKYTRASKMMYKYLETKGNLDQIWLCAGWQLLCLCSKINLHCSTRHSNENLRMSYETIKIIIKRVVEFNPLIGPLKDDVFKDFVNASADNLHLEIHNSLIPFESNCKSYPEIKQYERMFIESFVYNYSVSILVCATTDGLPDPFVVFNELRNALKTPLFNCEVSWMNNPVLGASFTSYELAAKASYLIRNMDDISTLQMARRLYEITKFSPVPIVPTETRIDPIKYQTLRDSTLVAEIVLGATKILLLKIMNVNLRESDLQIQSQVELIIKRLGQMSEHSHCKLIAVWALLICGISCIKESHRRIITQNCADVGELTHGCYVLTVFKALDIAWGRDENHYLSGMGIDILLDGDFLSQISL